MPADPRWADKRFHQLASRDCRMSFFTGGMPHAVAEARFPHALLLVCRGQFQMIVVAKKAGPDGYDFGWRNNIADISAQFGLGLISCSDRSLVGYGLNLTINWEVLDDAISLYPLQLFYELFFAHGDFDQYRDELATFHQYRHQLTTPGSPQCSSPSPTGTSKPPATPTNTNPTHPTRSSTTTRPPSAPNTNTARLARLLSTAYTPAHTNPGSGVA